MLAGGLSPPHVSTQISNTHTTPVVSLDFTSSTPMSPSTQVSMNTTTGTSNVVVIGIPSVPLTSYLLFQKF